MKIIIADDHSVVLLGTKMIIESELPEATVVLAKTYTELLKSYEEDSYDILFLDINMPGTKNVAMINELKTMNASTKIIVFSSYDEHVALEYIRAGADGYLNKMSEEDEVVQAIKSVIANGFYYSQKLAKLGMTTMEVKAIEKDLKSLLSNRESEVFDLLLLGLGNLEISSQLQLHMSTVSTYKKRILEKLQVSNVYELIKNFQ